jgi:hypothetical protein
MLTVKYLLEVAGFLLMAAAAAMLLHDIYRLYQQSNLILNNQPRPAEVRPRYRAAGRLTALALVTLLAGLSSRVVPSGMAGVRVSQISGRLPGSKARTTANSSSPTMCCTTLPAMAAAPPEKQ